MRIVNAMLAAITALIGGAVALAGLASGLVVLGIFATFVGCIIYGIFEAFRAFTS